MEEKYTVQTAMKWIVDRQGREIYQNDMLLNNMLSDLAREEENDRKKIRLALSSGAGTLFYRMLLQRGEENLRPQDISLFRNSMEGYGFTADFADFILNTFLYSVSMPTISDAKDTPSAEPQREPKRDLQKQEKISDSTPGDNSVRPEKPIPAWKAGEIVQFGRYQQDAGVNCTPKPIEWIVLELNIQEGKALLISRYGLDAKPYHTKWTDITWNKCSLRAWLNTEFLKTAFSIEEQSAILTTDVDNSRNQGFIRFDTYGGDNTKDRVFLLSYIEAYNYFGTTRNSNKNIKARIQPTAYALANRAQTWKIFGLWKTENGTAPGWWWLRSPGANQSSACYVDYEGIVAHSPVNFKVGCIRPAIWVNLKAGIF